MNQTSGAWRRQALPTKGLQYSQQRNRSAALLAVFVLAGLALSACGNKGPLKPPEASSQAVAANP